MYIKYTNLVMYNAIFHYLLTDAQTGLKLWPLVSFSSVYVLKVMPFGME